MLKSSFVECYGGLLTGDTLYKNIVEFADNNWTLIDFLKKIEFKTSAAYIELNCERLQCV